MKKVCLAVVVAFVFAVVSARAEDAKTTFEAKCAQCHGKDGKGDTKMGQKVGVKNLADAKYQESFTDDKAAKDIKEGIKDGDKTKMKAYGDVLSDADIKAIVAYVRQFGKADGAK